MSNQFKTRLTIYTKEHYDKVFAEIKNIPMHWNPKRINNYIREKITLPLSMNMVYKKWLMEKMPIYRARVQYENDIIDENCPKSFGCPPFRPTTHGRANRRGQVVFYASGDKITPFFEKRTDIEKQLAIEPEKVIVYLSKWIIPDSPDNVMINSIFLGVDENSTNFAAFMAKGMREQFNLMFAKLPDKAREYFEYCQMLYNGLFTTKGEEHYHITSSIAYQMFVSIYRKNTDIPIIAYPSVATDKNTVNFAFRKDFAERHLRLYEVEKVQMIGFEGSGVKYHRLKKGIFKDGDMNWSHYQLQVDGIDFNNSKVSCEGEEFKAIDTTTAVFSEGSNLEKMSFRAYLNNKRLNKAALQRWFKDALKQHPDVKLLNEGQKELMLPPPGDLFYSGDGGIKKVNRLLIRFSYSFDYI